MNVFQDQFNDAEKILNENGIYMKGNDGSVCMPLMFRNEDIIDYLQRHTGTGLQRLQDLSKLINLEGLSSCVEYNAFHSVNKWAKDNDDKFGDLIEKDKQRICGVDCYVYVNNYALNDKEEHNKYCKEDCNYSEEEIKQAESYNDNMLWFWLGEY